MGLARGLVVLLSAAAVWCRAGGQLERDPTVPTVPEVMAAMSLSTTKMAQLPPAEILHLHISFKASEVVVDRLVLEIVKQVGKLFLVVVAMEQLGMVANSSW